MIEYSFYNNSHNKTATSGNVKVMLPTLCFCLLLWIFFLYICLGDWWTECITHNYEQMNKCIIFARTVLDIRFQKTLEFFNIYTVKQHWCALLPPSQIVQVSIFAWCLRIQEFFFHPLLVLKSTVCFRLRWMYFGFKRNKSKTCQTFLYFQTSLVNICTIWQ